MYYFICLFGIIFLANAALEKEWKYFKTEFQKQYGTSTEDQRRFKIFKDNWNEIEKHNKRYHKGEETYLKEINRFGDLTDQEFTETYGLDENSYAMTYTDDLKINKSGQSNNDQYLDWRKFGAVTPAKDQGHCGSCWIFSSIGALESYNFLKTGKLLNFSEQHIVDCFSNISCEGGDPFAAFSFMQEHGVHLESDYPYNAEQNRCRNLTKEPFHVKFDNVDFVNSTNDDDLKNAVQEYGPLSVCLYVTYRWRFYKSGVWYNKECSPYSNHCILLVGYGTENGHDYWLFKNSWGPQWGQEGFIKVLRNKHENYCGINTGNAYLT